MEFLFEKHISLQIVDADGVITNVRIIPASNNDQCCWNFSEVKKFSEVKHHMELLRMNMNSLEDKRKYYIVCK